MMVVVLVRMLVVFVLIVIMGLPRIVVVMARMVMILHVRTAVVTCVFGCRSLAMIVRVLVDVGMRMWVIVGVSLAVRVAVTVAAGQQSPDQESNAGEHQHATDDLPFVGHHDVP